MQIHIGKHRQRNVRGTCLGVRTQTHAGNLHLFQQLDRSLSLSLSLSLSIYIYIYIYICIHVSMYAYTRTNTCIHALICTHS